MLKSEKNVLNKVLKELQQNRKDNLQESLSLTREDHRELRKQRKIPLLPEENSDLLPKKIEDTLEQDKLFNNLMEKLGQQPQQNTPTNTKHQEKQETPKIIKNIDQFYKDYIEHRQTFDKISNSSIKGYNASFRYLKHFIKEDTDLNFRFFKDIQKQFQQLPKNFFKYPKYYQLTFSELMELQKVEQYQTLDNKTINNHINSYKLFFKYLKYEELIDQNPLSDILPLSENKEIVKEEYTPTELKQIFTSNLDIDYLNMCKVSIYCGFRIEEVLSIKKTDIKDNIISIDIEDTGTKKHKRMVPIHDNLKKVIDFQTKHNAGDYLFFFGNVGNEVKNVGKRLNRRIKDIVPSKAKTFHSFRKNFSQEIELNTDAEEKTKSYLMGHSFNKNVTHTVYNRGKMNLDKLKDCINQITFDY